MDSSKKFPNAEHLKCSLCSKFYKDPKTLPCLHTFCKTCILKYIGQNCIDKPSKCAVCFETFEKNPDDVKSNTYLENMIHLLQTQTDCRDQVCNFCKFSGEIRLAVSQCLTCSEFLCEECSTSRHTFTTVTRDHKVVSLIEIRTGQHNDAIRSLQCSEKCPLHIEEELRYFCVPCKTVTCRDCSVLDHSGHKIKLLSVVRKESENMIKPLQNELTVRLSDLKRKRELIKSDQGKIESMEAQMHSNISKKCSEAVSKIDKGKNRVLMKLNQVMVPSRLSLRCGYEKISRGCKNIEESLIYFEMMQKGKDCEVIHLLDDINERFKKLSKVETSDDYLLKNMPHLTLQITEPQIELLVNKAQSPSTSEKSATRETSNQKDTDENTNLSDFVTYCSKAVQTSEEDFQITKENMEFRQRKYKLNMIRRFELRESNDMFTPIYSGIAWVDENHLVAVDKANAKIKMVSISSAEILKSVSGYHPLAVSVWKDGISCLSIDSQMTSFNRNFDVQKTLSGISALFASLPSLNQLIWTAKSVIYYQKNDILTKLPLTEISPNTCFLRYACCLPNGMYAVSDSNNRCVYLLSMKGELIETLNCHPGSISFDKYYNIFIADYENASIVVFDTKGNYKEKLLVEDRPRSISVLNDKLLIATEKKVLLYDIVFM
ncbi:E3 ubiquitin-protein ligase TRIM56-like [Saccostrea cucullata]|uniref:E3 ubiquitin-protein ligase TRIM56-like n=1 Tax=Saccostrea cuccullata TaxID=36930 RepID=UPI002ED26687